jgi:hypothetical protein
MCETVLFELDCGASVVDLDQSLAGVVLLFYYVGVVLVVDVPKVLLAVWREVPATMAPGPSPSRSLSGCGGSSGHDRVYGWGVRRYERR